MLLSALPLAMAQAGGAVVNKLEDGVTVAQPAGTLRLQVLSPTVIRVLFAKDPKFFEHESLAVLPHEGMKDGWKLSSADGTLTLATAKVKAVVDLTTGAVKFQDDKGQPILAELPNGRSLEPATVQSEKVLHVRQQWATNPGEALYGLGQRQIGVLNIKGYDLDLWQRNTHVVVPFLVSNKGYGIYWDNNSFTRFGDLRGSEMIPAQYLYDTSGVQGGLTETALDGSASVKKTAVINIDLPQDAHAKNMRWEGSLEVPVTGDYQFFGYSNGGIKLWIDGRLVINHWRQNWLTEYDQVKVRLASGKRHAVKIENDSEQQSTFKVFWKTPNESDATSLWSEVADGIDYYFVYGPKLDDVIAGMRFLTGKATMMPNWAFGLWQSRQRYETQQQSLDVVKEFRKREIPFDNIVQDWQYWRVDDWGSHKFDPTRFPDPDGWIKQIHEAHCHVMISVWGKFNPNSDNGQEMISRGFLYPANLLEKTLDWLNYPHSEYDAFNPSARKLFWQRINERLFSKGIDAWWMDATEPDMFPSPPTLDRQKKHMNPTYLGTGARMLNAYPLENSLGVYTGQREAAPNQRVFILTRSGYAGEQRYSTATWSGDISSTWTAMAKQLPAGLGFSISGTPYWTMDTGGYTMQAKWSGKNSKPEDDLEWQEMNARWFELSTFTPFLRVHGEVRDREIWTMGESKSEAYQAILKFDKLRYALFPYIYSLAGAVVQHDQTMMRPLVMDYPNDPRVLNLTDEYSFGPSLLVAPVTSYKVRSRAIYLPAAAGWYDFWSGKTVTGGAQFIAPAPYNRIPAFVRAGSIIPFGPAVQYIGEKPADPLTIYVYAGANGQFTLYEDEGTTFEYEKGAFTEIPLSWSDASRTLTIGARKGSFTGMPAERSFRVALVSRVHASGYDAPPANFRTVKYTGAAVKVTLP
jgi:alpha-D-xyloside xylohydrolase